MLSWGDFSSVKDQSRYFCCPVDISNQRFQVCRVRMPHSQYSHLEECGVGVTNPGTLFPLLYFSLHLVDGADFCSNSRSLLENKIHSEMKNSSSEICQKTIFVLIWHKPKVGLIKWKGKCLSRLYFICLQMSSRPVCKLYF